MYQFIYPWLTPDMFRVHMPNNVSACKELDKDLVMEADFCMAGNDNTKHQVSTPTIEPNRCQPDVDDQIYRAAQKFIQYVEKRDTVVTYHGPDTCSDKKPWAIYAHFHVTVIADRRLGADTMYNNVVALHRKIATCHIPASQITRFPASWANYLTQRPRTPWYVGNAPLITEFAQWTMNEYINRQVPLPANRKRLFEDAQNTNRNADADADPDEALLHMRNGKVQKLYDCLSWQIKEHDYATREDLVDGALSHGTSDNFSRALIHPHFDTLLNKAFTMDRAIEINTPFKIQLQKMKWEKFNTDKYLAKDVSLELIKQILETQGISTLQFTRDVHDLLTLAKPKNNLLCLEGVPNSGKSFIARSIAALYKYQNTCQGTSSFPFMEIASASIGLIEEPVFNNDALQKFKKLAEGTPTDVAVKNRKAARVPQIPLIITSNYDFVVQGGSTEKSAFNSRMKKYMFKAACGFLKLAKKMLNPGIWQDLFDAITPDETDGSSSDDNELREYLNMTTSRQQRQNEEDARRQAEEDAQCSLLMSKNKCNHDWQTDRRSQKPVIASTGRIGVPATPTAQRGNISTVRATWKQSAH